MYLLIIQVLGLPLKNVSGLQRGITGKSGCFFRFNRKIFVDFGWKALFSVPVFPGSTGKYTAGYSGFLWLHSPKNNFEVQKDFKIQKIRKENFSAWPQSVTFFLKCAKMCYFWENVLFFGKCTILDLFGSPKFWDHFIFCIILQPYQLLWHRLFYFSYLQIFHKKM